MPIISNNNFNRDDYSTRMERLNAIQASIQSLQAELELPEFLFDWAKTCYDEYFDLSVDSGVDFNFKRSFSSKLNRKLKKMDEEYQVFKNIVTSIYRKYPVYLSDFNLNVAYPKSRNNKIAKVEYVLQVLSSHKAKGIDLNVPEHLVERLNTAKDELLEIIIETDNSKIEAKHKKAEYVQRFNEDTEKLQLLKAWWFAKMKDSTHRINIIGMVNPKTRGSGKRINPPDEIDFNIQSKKLSWEAIENATSYEVVAKLINSDKDFDEIYTGNENFTQINLPKSDYLIKIRARNKKGFGDWSEEIEITVA